MKTCADEDAGPDQRRGNRRVARAAELESLLSPPREMPGAYIEARTRLVGKKTSRRQIAVLSLLAFTGAALRGLGGPDKRRRRRWMSQKQSLLIASPSGREVRTQDHLGIIYILL